MGFEEYEAGKIKIEAVEQRREEKLSCLYHEIFVKDA
jgi:hypothetical protein